MKITRKEGWKMSWESLDNHGHLMIKRDPLIYTYRKEEWWLGIICYTIWGCLNEASFVAHLSYRDGKEEHTEAIDRPHWGWKMEFLWLWLIMMLTNKTRSYHALQDFARGRFYANSITRKAQILCSLITLDDKTCPSGCLLQRKSNAISHLISNLLQFKVFI